MKFKKSFACKRADICKQAVERDSVPMSKFSPLMQPEFIMCMF